MYLYNFVLWIEQMLLIEVYYWLETSLKYRRIQQLTSVVNNSPLIVNRHYNYIKVADISKLKEKKNNLSKELERNRNFII